MDNRWSATPIDTVVSQVEPPCFPQYSSPVLDCAGTMGSGQSDRPPCPDRGQLLDSGADALEALAELA